MTTTSFAARLRQILILACASFAASAFAQALPSSLKLVFTQQTGTASATASIPVMLTLTNTSASQAFVFNSSLPNFGLNPSALPTTGYYFDVNGVYTTATFASYSSANLGSSFGCATTFTTSCTSGPPYNFNFAPGLTSPLSLAAGASTSYLFGTFVPSAGAVAPGTYSFFYAAAIANISGLDSAGHVLSSTLTLAETCPGQSAAACGAAGYFSRTVVAVPEPATWGLMALGLGIVAMRRRVKTIGSA